MNRPTLDELGVKYGTDKSSHGSEPWMWSQNYLNRVYEPLLEPLRDQPITILELGWGEYDPIRKDHANPLLGGRSARMWCEYFTQANIAVIDIEPKANYTVNSGTLFQGSQDDPEFLRSVYLQTGPYDVIIDDASHISSLTIASFKILWPYLKAGGWYFVEDVHSSFHDWYFGPDEANPDPGSHATNTAVHFFQRLSTEPFFHGKRKKGPPYDGDRYQWDCFPKRFWLGYQIEEVRFCAPQLIAVRKRYETDYA